MAGPADSASPTKGPNGRGLFVDRFGRGILGRMLNYPPIAGYQFKTEERVKKFLKRWGVEIKSANVHTMDVLDYTTYDKCYGHMMNFVQTMRNCRYKTNPYFRDFASCDRSQYVAYSLVSRYCGVEIEMDD